MKICEYCGSENLNEASVCKACGGNSFKYVCGRCGTEFSSMYCPNCGLERNAVPKICPQCGKQYFSNACPNCGYTDISLYDMSGANNTQYVYDEPQPKLKNKSTALILAVFLGYFGAHYFYVGKKRQGRLFLFTFGFFGYGWLFDILRIIFNRFEDCNGYYLWNDIKNGPQPE